MTKKFSAMLLSFQSALLLAVLSTFFGLSVPIAQQASTNVPVPSIIAGPTPNPSNGHIYYLLSRDNWTNSESFAQMLGGHLVTINDQAENDWVYNSFSAFGGVERSLWLGFTDRDVAGTFGWTSGEPVTYTNWSVGQPNNGITASRGPEFFAHMWSPDFCRTNGFIPGTWNDYVDLDLVDGTSPLNGVVELEPAICIEGLVSRWKADGDATDSVDGNNGTLRDGVTFVPGTFGQAFRSGYVEVENSPSLETPTLSVSVWVRSQTPGSPGPYNYIVSKGSDGCWSPSYGLSTQGTGGLVFHIYAGNFQGAGSPDAGAGVWDGNWHHVVGTFDGAYVRLYVDGNEIGNGTPTSIQVKYDLPTSRKLLIGAYNNTIFYPNGVPACRYGFGGDIDDVKVYNRALCAAAIQATFNGSNTCACPNDDNEAPAITCPANMNIGNDAGQCSANVNPGAATATDNVDGSITPTGTRSDGLALSDPYPIGTTTITWTATDAAGNSASCQQTVMVNDTQPPAISCPTDMTAARPANACSPVVNYSTPAATDNCSTASVSCSPPSGATFPIGSTTVVCTAHDAANNTARCSFTINVVNHTPSANGGGPYSVLEGGAVPVAASGDDSDGDSLAFAWDLDNNGSFETSGQNATFSAAALDGPGSRIIRVQVTDSCGSSIVAQATVNVLNVAPTVGAITAPVDPNQVNTTINASANFADPGVLDTHTATWNWGDGSTTTGTVGETSGSGSVSGSHIYAAAGVYTVALIVTDKDGGSGQAIFQYVVIYDPSAGFVTGGGWINSPAGAYTLDPLLTGKATFGFVSKYQRGATVPTGNTQFTFHVASMNFNSTSYDWLVIAGAKAQYKGTGTINGTGNYGFMLSAIDGQINGGGGVDKFRIKIWDKVTGNIVYDNQMGGGDAADPTTAIAGGSIVIHSN